MNKKNEKFSAELEYIHPKDALSVVEQFCSNDLLCMIHEPCYPDTRKDVCIVRKTMIDIQGEYDIVYLLWKQKDSICLRKIWSTSAYDPPEEQYLFVGYVFEKTDSIVVKLYKSSNPTKGSVGYPGTLCEFKKESLGLK